MLLESSAGWSHQPAGQEPDGAAAGDDALREPLRQPHLPQAAGLHCRGLQVPCAVALQQRAPKFMYFHQQIGKIPFVLNCALPNRVIASLLPHKRMQLSHPCEASFWIQALFCFKSSKWKNPLHCSWAVCKAVSLCLYCGSDAELFALGKELHISLI